LLLIKRTTIPYNNSTWRYWIDDVDKIPVCPFLKEVLIKKVREGKQEFILYSLNLIASKERNTFSKKS
jgi:hypothetical protein